MDNECRITNTVTNTSIGDFFDNVNRIIHNMKMNQNYFTLSKDSSFYDEVTKAGKRDASRGCGTGEKN